MSSLVFDLNKAGKPLPKHVGAAVATPEACKDLLAASPSATALLVRSAYAADKVWPSAPDARHPEAVVGLDTQPAYACYACQSASLTHKGVHKPLGAGAGGGVDGGGGEDGGDGESEAPPPPPSVPAVCVNTAFYRVFVQTLLRGNKTAFFPVAFTRVVGTASLAAAAGVVVGGDGAAAGGASDSGGGGRGGGHGIGGARPQAAAPSPAPAPPSAVLSVDDFLGLSASPAMLGGRRRNRAWSTLPTAELESSPATCGGLLHTYDWLGRLREGNWTPSSVLERFGVYDNPTNATPSEPRGWLFFLCLRAAVSKVFDLALKHLRKCDPTVLGKLAIGSLPTTPTAGTVEKALAVGHYPAFNIRVQPRTVERYEHDAALVLYAAAIVGVDARRSAAVAMEEGTVVPVLSTAVSDAVAHICAAYPPPPPAPAAGAAAVNDEQEEVEEEEEGEGGGGGGPPRAAQSTPRAAVAAVAKEIGEGRLLEPTAIALVALCHEQFDPRSVANGGTGKFQSDLTMLLPFLSVLYAHHSCRSPATLSAGGAGGADGGGGASSAARASGVSIMDATGAQHLAASLLFTVRIANTVHFMHRQLPTVEDLFAEIGYLSDPSQTTAASSVVMLYERSAKMAAVEAKTLVYLPCNEASHTAGIPPALGVGHCGALLGRGVHLSTVAVGQRVAAMQEEMFRRMTDLLFGYDPASSGVLGPDALLLVDRVSNADPGVSLLQIADNEERVRRWLSHFLSSGALDGDAVPVRPTYKAADGGGGAGGGGGGGGGGGRS